MPSCKTPPPALCVRLTVRLPVTTLAGVTKPEACLSVYSARTWTKAASVAYALLVKGSLHTTCNRPVVKGQQRYVLPDARDCPCHVTVEPSFSSSPHNHRMWVRHHTTLQTACLTDKSQQNLPQTQTPSTGMQLLLATITMTRQITLCAKVIAIGLYLTGRPLTQQNDLCTAAHCNCQPTCTWRAGL